MPKKTFTDALDDTEAIIIMGFKANAEDKAPPKTPPITKPTTIDRATAPSLQPDAEPHPAANRPPMPIRFKSTSTKNGDSTFLKSTGTQEAKRGKLRTEQLLPAQIAGAKAKLAAAEAQLKDAEKKGVRSERQALLDPITTQSAGHVPGWATVQLRPTNTLLAKQPTTWFIRLKSPHSLKNLELWALLPRSVSTQPEDPDEQAKHEELPDEPHSVRLWKGGLKQSITREIEIPLRFTQSGVHELTIRLQSAKGEKAPIRWNVICPVYQGTAIPTQKSIMRHRFNLNSELALTKLFHSLAYVSGQVIMLPADFDDFVRLGLSDASYDEVLNATCRQLRLQSGTEHGTTVVFRK